MGSIDTTKKIGKDISNGPLLKSAHFITTKSPDDFPNIKYYLEALLKNTDIKIKHVGKSFQHSHLRDVRDYSLYGTFLSYFIRKHLSNQLNVPLTDFHSEQILKKPNKYTIGTKPDIHKAIEKHYKIYKNHRTTAMDILKSIQIVALSELLYFHHDQFKTDYYVSEDNLWEVVKYFQKLPYRMVELNANLRCKYFYGHADLLFDNEIIYDIRISSFTSLSRIHKTINISQFYKMIICAFGFYKKTRKMLKTFKIYNPLLGYEYSIQLNDIDFDLLENVLKRDTTAYGFLQEFKNVNVSLDLGLFPNNESTTAAPKESHSNGVCKIPSKSKVVAISDLVTFEHFANFEISDSNDIQIHKKLNKSAGTGRIRKWERISLEETALLNINRGKKMIKRRAKNSNL